MTIEVLYFEGCPNHEDVIGEVAELVKVLGIDAEVHARAVESEALARELRFLGSPTVRVDGRDVEPGAELRTDYGLKCRIYRTAAGLAGRPPQAWLRAAIQAAARG